MVNATIDSWRSVGEEGRSPGVATTALYRAQEDSTSGKIMGKTAVAPFCSQVCTVPRRPVVWERQPEAVGRHGCFSL